jgi:hypothetical protein
MAETASAPIPLQVSQRFEDVAAGQGVVAFDIDPVELAAAVEDSGEVERYGQNAGVLIGASKPFGGDDLTAQLFDGRDIGHYIPVSSTALGPDKSVIKLQVHPHRQITEADLAQRVAETILAPARGRNSLYNRGLMGLLGLGSGTLLSTVAYIDHINQPETSVSPSTWAWLGAAGVALATSIVGFTRGFRQGNRINNAEQRAAQRTPITVRHRGE